MTRSGSSTRASTLVCIPTYDEADALPALLNDLLIANPTVDVLVIDDASPDGTGEIADLFAEQNDRVHVLHRTGKQGLGAAYRAAFAWGLQRGYAVLVEMDADGSHRPADLPALLAAVDEGADLALGSRWVPGGSTVNWPLKRILLSRGGNLYARLCLRVPIRDITGGFRAVRADLLERIVPATTTSQGYAFQVELALRALDDGALIEEVPITFVERSRGASKMSTRIVLEAMLQVTRWGLRRTTPTISTEFAGLRALTAIHGGQR